MARSLIVLIFLCLQNFIFCQSPAYQWAKQFGATSFFNNGNDNGRSVAVDAMGNVYSIGLFQKEVDFDPGPGYYPMTALNGDATAIYISKLNPFGQFVWVKQIPLLVEGDMFLTLDKDANVYITSGLKFAADMDPGPGVVMTTPTGAEDAFLLKLDKDGNFIWVRQFGGLNASSIAQGKKLDIDPLTGDIVMCGSFSRTVDFDPGPNTSNLVTTGSFEAFIVKLTKNGDFIWAKQLGRFNSVFSNIGISDIKCDVSGNILSTGSFVGNCDFDPGPNNYNLSNTGDGDLFITKLDKNGNFIWAKTAGETDPIYSSYSRTGGGGIDADNQGNIYVSGVFDGPIVDFDPGPAVNSLTNAGFSDEFVMKIDPAGNFVWVKDIGGVNYDYNWDLCVDVNNNVYVLGSHEGIVDFDPGPAVNNQYCYGHNAIVKLDENGNFIYVTKFSGSAGYTRARQIVVDANKNLYSTGHFAGEVDFDPGVGVDLFNSQANSTDAFVIKLGPCLNVTSSVLNISTCNNYSLNGHIYDSTGTYFQTIPNSFACDSIIRLNLIVNRKYMTRSINICDGQTFLAGGENQNTSGTYKDTLQTALGCDSIITTNLNVHSNPKPNLGADKKVCTNEIATISPGSFVSYLWQDNSTEASNNIHLPGLYWVKVTDFNGCSATDSLNILAIDTIPTNFLPATMLICQGNRVSINVPNYKNYLWSNGTTGNSISISSIGIYQLSVTDFNGCSGKDTLSVQKNPNCIPFAIPSAFTPDGNGINDFFKPLINQDLVDYHFVIFNRYGQKIFETTDLSSGWNGKYKGELQPGDAYVYWVQFKNTQAAIVEYRGSFILIR